VMCRRHVRRTFAEPRLTQLVKDRRVTHVAHSSEGCGHRLIHNCVQRRVTGRGTAPEQSGVRR
jgi:hypothetical protein